MVNNHEGKLPDDFFTSEHSRKRSTAMIYTPVDESKLYGTDRSRSRMANMLKPTTEIKIEKRVCQMCGEVYWLSTLHTHMELCKQCKKIMDTFESSVDLSDLS